MTMFARFMIVIIIEVAITILIVLKNKNNVLKCELKLGGFYGILTIIGAILHLNIMYTILPNVILAFARPILNVSGIVFGIIIYMVPTMIAYNKKHNNRLGILIVNILLGWSILGWLGTLLWACILGSDSNKNISTNKYEDLARLQKLKEDGTITETEFELEKAKLLR